MAERFTEEILREVWQEAERRQAEPFVLQERAKIIEWLRGPDPYPDGHDIADAIEMGEHLK